MADWGLVAIRFALYADLMLLFGLPLFSLYAVNGAKRHELGALRVRALTGWLALVGIALSLLGIFAMTAAMFGVSLFRVDLASVTAMIFETEMGIAWTVRMLALIFVLLASNIMVRGRPLNWLLVASTGAATALASLAWTGHGAASEGAKGIVQLVADIIHLLAAGAWLGALFAFAAMLLRNSAAMTAEHLRLTHLALDRFSIAGAIIVALVVASGLVNSWMLVGPQNILMLHTTLYGRLLIAKLLLFVIMLILAATNRFRLTPALGGALHSGTTSGAVGTLRLSLALELGIATTILGLVAWFGMLEPPMSM